MSKTNTPHATLSTRTCSDCGRQSDRLTTTFDPTTRSEVALCPSCTIAFQHRQQFSPGCCE